MAKKTKTPSTPPETDELYTDEPDTDGGDEYDDDETEEELDTHPQPNPPSVKKNADGGEQPEPPEEEMDEVQIKETFDKLKEAARVKKQQKKVAEEIEEVAVGSLKVTVTLSDGSKKQLDPEKDREFCVYCVKCHSYISNLTFRNAARFKKALEQYGCECENHEFQMTHNEYVTLAEEFGVKAVPIDKEIVRFIFDKIIVKNVAEVKLTK